MEVQVRTINVICAVLLVLADFLIDNQVDARAIKRSTRDLSAEEYKRVLLDALAYALVKNADRRDEPMWTEVATGNGTAPWTGISLRKQGPRIRGQRENFGASNSMDENRRDEPMWTEEGTNSDPAPMWTEVSLRKQGPRIRGQRENFGASNSMDENRRDEPMWTEEGTNSDPAPMWTETAIYNSQNASASDFDPNLLWTEVASRKAKQLRGKGKKQH